MASQVDRTKLEALSREYVARSLGIAAAWGIEVCVVGCGGERIRILLINHWDGMGRDRDAEHGN